MAEPVSKEDIQDHPWLVTWNKMDESGRIDILRAKVMELEDLIGTASIILIIISIAVVTAFVIYILSSFSSGAVSMSDVSQIGGLIKQFKGK